VNEYGERYQRYSNWNIFFKFFTGYLFEEKRAEQLLIKLYTAIHEHGNDLNPTELQLAIKECIDEAGIGLFSSYLKYDLKQHEQVLKVDPEFKQQLVVRRDVLLKSQLGTLETTVVDLQSQVVRLSDDQKLKEKALEETSQQLSFLQSQIEAKSKETELFKQQLQASLEATQKAHAEAMMRLEEENHTLNEKVRTMKEAPTSTLTFIKGFESTPIPLAPKDEQRFAALEEKNQELSKQVEDLTRDMLTLLEVVKKKNDTHRLNSNATSQAPSNIHPSF